MFLIFIAYYRQVKGTTEVTGFRRSLATYTRITNLTAISLISHLIVEPQLDICISSVNYQISF